MTNDTKQLLKKLAKGTGRSLNQTLRLFELLGEDYNLLVKLEEKLKNQLHSYSPNTTEECMRILNEQPNGRKWFDLSDFYLDGK